MTDNRYHINPPRNSASKDVVRQIQGEVEPAEIDIRNDGPRATDADRTATMNYLNRAYHQGCLTEPEKEARHAAAERAASTAQLTKLVSDLPQIPPGRSMHPATFVALHAAWVVASVTLALVPGALTAGLHVVNGAGEDAAVWVPTFTAGAVSLVFCILHFIAFWKDDEN